MKRSLSPQKITAPGRIALPLVEDPVITTIHTRVETSLELKLICTSQYKSITGARRQSLKSTRKWAQSFVPASKPELLANQTALPIVSKIQWMQVPEFLNEELWERHGYSLNDIKKTLSFYNERILWQLVLSHGCMATNAATRVSSDSDIKLTCDGRAAAITKLMALIGSTVKDRPSCLWNMAKLDDPNGDGLPYKSIQQHNPCLPVHKIHKQTFATLATGKKNTIFSWRKILIVVLEINDAEDLLLVGRVMPWSLYVEAFGVPKTLKQMPNRIQEAERQYALLNETFYFFSPQDHKRQKK